MLPNCPGEYPITYEYVNNEAVDRAVNREDAWYLIVGIVYPLLIAVAAPELRQAFMTGLELILRPLLPGH